MKHKYGFTTGSCAAGAAKGAAYGLLQGTIPDSVDINTPANVTLHLSLIHREVDNNFAECAIRKYAGDDPDITNGCEVHVRVERSKNKGIRFMSGGGRWCGYETRATSCPGRTGHKPRTTSHD